jgi:FixJ family two-component response regulator
MMSARPLVCVVDDDASVREALPDLLHELGFASQAFPSAKSFLSSSVLGDTRCLILDIAMRGMTGPELHRELVDRHLAIPVIFVTALGDETLRPRLLARGAVDCLFKPVSEQALIEALEAALHTNGVPPQSQLNTLG